MLKCQKCQEKYSYSKEFLSKFSIESFSIPKLCPTCRTRRRLCFRNERNYYKRKCDYSKKEIISIYPPIANVKVYEHKIWYSDAWDALDYGVDYDENRSFFEQFFELHAQVPLMSLDVKSDNENCDYCHLITGSKDCYQVVACTKGEECLYTSFLQRNINVVDCFFIFDSSFCYECIDCYNCYELLFSNYCHNCSVSSYLENCRACSDCFACVGLTQAKYRILNKEYSREKYLKLLTRLKNDQSLLQEVLKRWEQLKNEIAVKYYSGFQNENFTGDHLHYCKNTFNSFDCTYLEDCKNCIWFHKAKDCQDCYGWGTGGELAYECHLVGNNFFNLAFCESCWGNISNLRYSWLCLDGSKDLFGCVSLRGKQYCILNKQYSKEEYEKLTEKIVHDMKKREEWGEYFPAKYSPFAYNESMANEYYPLNKQEVLSNGHQWRDELPYTKNRETIEPPYLKDEKILKEILSCNTCQRNYQITALELEFYNKLNLDIPTLCFHCRHNRRQVYRNKRELKQLNCFKCKREVLSSYEERKVFCENCQ